MPALPYVAWPDLASFRLWLGATLTAAENGTVRSDVAFGAAYEAVWERLDQSLLPENTYLPRRNEDGTLEDPPTASCPNAIRQAIMIQAGRLFTRRDSLTGVLSFSEYGVRLSELDPDVKTLIRTWVGKGTP